MECANPSGLNHFFFFHCTLIFQTTATRTRSRAPQPQNPTRIATVRPTHHMGGEGRTDHRPSLPQQETCRGQHRPTSAQRTQTLDVCGRTVYARQHIDARRFPQIPSGFPTHVLHHHTIFVRFPHATRVMFQDTLLGMILHEWYVMMLADLHANTVDKAGVALL